MRFLLDTHTAIWATEDDPRLSGLLRDLLADPAHELCLSIASVWEMSIKEGLGKLGLKVGVPKTVDTILRHRVRLLPIELSHVLAVQHLPPHHGDPFDRLLIAQTKIEGLTLLSRDETFDQYGVTRLW